MNVAFFSNQFAAASGHGIAHYAHRLYEELRIEVGLNVIPVATWSNRSPQAVRVLQQETGLRLLPWGRKLTPLAWTYLNAPPIEHWLDNSIDVTHMVSPGFPVATRKKLVVTVHDVGPIVHPEFFADSKPWLFKRGIEHTVRYADAIVCVSQSTADELVECYGSQVSQRIQVIHEGVDADFFSKDPIDPYLELCEMSPKGLPFFLAAGALSPRKNIKRVLKAFMRTMDTIPHHLVLVGGKGWDSLDVFNQLTHPDLKGRVHHLGYVSDEQLQALYKYADFYIHPSLFEGFGLTVLEAMASGCPVIASNISSLPEVSGNAAKLVDPTSTDEITEAIHQYATDSSLRAIYRVRGYERVKKFQWSETARKVSEVYSYI